MAFSICFLDGQTTKENMLYLPIDGETNTQDDFFKNKKQFKMIEIVGVFIAIVVSYMIVGLGGAGILHAFMTYVLREKLPSQNYNNVAFFSWILWIGYIIYFTCMIMFYEPPCDATTFFLHQIYLFSTLLVFAVYFSNQNND